MMLLMVPMQRGASQRIDLPITEGNPINIYAYTINAETGKKVAEVPIRLNGPMQVHFTASSKTIYHGLYYLQYEWKDQRTKRTIRYCSCLEAASCGYCQHL